MQYLGQITCHKCNILKCMYSLKLRASRLCRPSTRFYVCDRTSRAAL